jgi:S-DNA-T family DNA segregation ATPase FtsK/SpoIIIE
MKATLKRLKIKADLVKEEHTGNVSRYYLKLAPGTSLEKLEHRAVEIALAIQAYGKPLIHPIMHQGVVVLEFITKPPTNVSFNEFDLGKYTDQVLPVIIGKAQDGQELVIDLAQAPHALIAGSTGSGKSVLLNSVICSLIEGGRDVKLALIDPKRVELTSYKSIKQLMYPIANTSYEAEDILDDLIHEMNDRFRLMSKWGMVNVRDLHKRQRPPLIVMVVDEFADLVLSSGKEFTNKICVLAQKSRAAGIHIVLATQRPSARIVNGGIKANFPTRISMKLPSSVDSRIILDQSGAEKLCPRGDGLIIHGQLNMVRFQGALLDREDIQSIAIKNEISLKTKLYRTLRSIL